MNRKLIYKWEDRSERTRYPEMTVKYELINKWIIINES